MLSLKFRYTITLVCMHSACGRPSFGCMRAQIVCMYSSLLVGVHELVSPLHMGAQPVPLLSFLHVLFFAHATACLCIYFILLWMRCACKSICRGIWALIWCQVHFRACLHAFSHVGRSNFCDMYAEIVGKAHLRLVSCMHCLGPCCFQAHFQACMAPSICAYWPSIKELSLFIGA
jgi:hypothetical protein